MSYRVGRVYGRRQILRRGIREGGDTAAFKSRSTGAWHCAFNFGVVRAA